MFFVRLFDRITELYYSNKIFSNFITGDFLVRLKLHFCGECDIIVISFHGLPDVEVIKLIDVAGVISSEGTNLLWEKYLTGSGLKLLSIPREIVSTTSFFFEL